VWLKGKSQETYHPIQRATARRQNELRVDCVALYGHQAILCAFSTNDVGNLMALVDLIISNNKGIVDL
jgi:hypothetical protein